MFNEGIVLGHKISERGIEVDKAKVDAIEKMPCPKDIKGIRSFLGTWHLFNSINFGFINFNTSLKDLVPQDNAFIEHNVTLFPIQDETSVFASL